MPDDKTDKTRLDRLPEHDNGETRQSQPIDLEQTQQTSATTGMPPASDTARIPSVTPPAQPPYPVPTGQHPRAMPPRKQPPRKRRRGSYIPPLWSILLTMIGVLGVAFGMVFVVVNIGGTTPPIAPPQVVFLTAVPTDTPGADESISVLASPTLPGEIVVVSPAANGELALQGPTLPPVVFTPTPDVISVGRTVMVVGVQLNQLNVRDEPGISTNVIFRVPDGHTFTIVDGPLQAEGLTWWKVQDQTTQEAGWAASNYLELVPEQR